MSGSEVYFSYSSYMWPTFTERDRNTDSLGQKFKDVLNRALPQNHTSSEVNQVNIQSEALSFDELGVLVLRKPQKSTKVEYMHDTAEKQDLLKTQGHMLTAKDMVGERGQSTYYFDSTSARFRVFESATNASGLLNHSKGEGVNDLLQSSLANQVLTINPKGTKSVLSEKSITLSNAKTEIAKLAKGFVSDVNISVIRGETGLIIRILTHIMDEDQKRTLTQRLEALISKTGETVENIEFVFVPENDDQPKTLFLKRILHGPD